MSISRGDRCSNSPENSTSLAFPLSLTLLSLTTPSCTSWGSSEIPALAASAAASRFSPELLPNPTSSATDSPLGVLMLNRLAEMLVPDIRRVEQIVVSFPRRFVGELPRRFTVQFDPDGKLGMFRAAMTESTLDPFHPTVTQIGPEFVGSYLCQSKEVDVSGKINLITLDLDSSIVSGQIEFTQSHRSIEQLTQDLRAGHSLLAMKCNLRPSTFGALLGFTHVEMNQPIEFAHHHLLDDLFGTAGEELCGWIAKNRERFADTQSIDTVRKLVPDPFSAIVNVSCRKLQAEVPRLAECWFPPAGEVQRQHLLLYHPYTAVELGIARVLAVEAGSVQVLTPYSLLEERTMRPPSVDLDSGEDFARHLFQRPLEQYVYVWSFNQDGVVRRIESWDESKSIAPEFVLEFENFVQGINQAEKLLGFAPGAIVVRANFTKSESLIRGSTSSASRAPHGTVDWFQTPDVIRVAEQTTLQIAQLREKLGAIQLPTEKSYQFRYGLNAAYVSTADALLCMPDLDSLVAQLLVHGRSKMGTFLDYAYSKLDFVAEGLVGYGPKEQVLVYLLRARSEPNLREGYVQLNVEVKKSLDRLDAEIERFFPDPNRTRPQR